MGAGVRRNRRSRRGDSRRDLERWRRPAAFDRLCSPGGARNRQKRAAANRPGSHRHRPQRGGLHAEMGNRRRGVTGSGRRGARGQLYRERRSTTADCRGALQRPQDDREHRDRDGRGRPARRGGQGGPLSVGEFGGEAKVLRLSICPGGGTGGEHHLQHRLNDHDRQGTSQRPPGDQGPVGSDHDRQARVCPFGGGLHPEVGVGLRRDRRSRRGGSRRGLKRGRRRAAFDSLCSPGGARDHRKRA